MKRDYLRMTDLSPAETRALFTRTRALKEGRKAGRRESTLAGRHLVCIFEKASTRTRLSFETAMTGLGGTVTSTAFTPAAGVSTSAAPRAATS